MKKLALTTVCALAMTGAAFAQGNVNWSVISPAAMTAQTNSTQISPLFGGAANVGGAVGNTALAAGGFYYELLYTTYSGTQATIPTLAALLSWSDTGLSANNSASSAGKLVPIANTGAAQVPWSPGTTDSIVLVGWSANLGTTWGSVSNVLVNWNNNMPGAFFGVSTTGYITPFSTSTSPGATVFASAPVAGTGTPIYSLNTPLYLLPVPEPASLAIAGLGGLSLLLFRRQRK
jgi:hypothetical protein